MMAPRFPLEWMEATAKAVDDSGCKLFLRDSHRRRG